MSDAAPEYEVNEETGEVIEPEPEPESELEPEPEQPDGGQSLEAQAGEFDELYAKLQTKATNYQKGAVALVNDAQEGGSEVPLEVCEMCNDAFAGFRWAQPNDELHAQMYAAAGIMLSMENLQADPDAEQCPTCLGNGIVKLPSNVSGNKARTCRRCNGAGYLDRHPESGSLIAAARPTGNGRSEPLPGVPSDDPVIADLAARGYTIVPPMQQPIAE